MHEVHYWDGDRTIADEKDDSAMEHLNTGNALALLYDWNGAIREYSWGIRDGPSEDLLVELYQRRGDAYLNKGRLYGCSFAAIVNRAVSNYGYAIAVRPDSSRAYLSRARAYMAGCHLRQALRDFDRAITAAKATGDHSQIAIAYRERGVVYRRVSRYEQALSDLGQSLAWEPENAEARKSYADLVKICGLKNNLEPVSAERRDDS